MKKFLFVFVCVMGLMCSCENESVEIESVDTAVEIVGADRYLDAVMPNLLFLKQLSDNAEITTKAQISELESNVELKQKLAFLVEESRRFLELNGVVIADFFDDENDLRIGYAGLALMQYNNLHSADIVTRGAGASIDQAADCLLKAAGISELSKKAVAKVIAKAASRLVPYVGVTLFTVELAACLFK